MGGNSSLTNVKLSHTQILSGNIQGKAWSLYSSYEPPGQNLPKYNKYVYLVFGDWVLTSCSFLSSVHFVFLSIFETPSIDGVTKVSHNVVIFLLIQITLSSFYLVTNYYSVEKNFIWWLWDLIFVKTSCRGHYYTII